MTFIKTIYLGNLRTEAEHLDSGSKLITSAPKDNNGDGLLFSPPTFLPPHSAAVC